MELSSPRFKALAVSAGFTFWFFIITSTLGIFSIESFTIFVIGIFSIMQLLSVKVSKLLDIFAIYNTKIFLGILFIFVISLYGIFTKLLHFDLLRLKKQNDTYWLKVEKLDASTDLKGY